MIKEGKKTRLEIPFNNVTKTVKKVLQKEINNSCFQIFEYSKFEIPVNQIIQDAKLLIYSSVSLYALNKQHDWSANMGVTGHRMCKIEDIRIDK